MILKRAGCDHTFAEPESHSLKDASLFANKAFAELISERNEQLSDMAFSNKIFELQEQIERPRLNKEEEEKDCAAISRIGLLKDKSSESLKDKRSGNCLSQPDFAM